MASVNAPIHALRLTAHVVQNVERLALQWVADGASIPPVRQRGAVAKVAATSSNIQPPVDACPKERVAVGACGANNDVVARIEVRKVYVGMHPAPLYGLK